MGTRGSIKEGAVSEAHQPETQGRALRCPGGGLGADSTVTVKVSALEYTQFPYLGVPASPASLLSLLLVFVFCIAISMFS